MESELQFTVKKYEWELVKEEVNKYEFYDVDNFFHKDNSYITRNFKPNTQEKIIRNDLPMMFIGEYVYLPEYDSDLEIIGKVVINENKIIYSLKGYDICLNNIKEIRKIQVEYEKSIIEYKETIERLKQEKIKDINKKWYEFWKI